MKDCPLAGFASAAALTAWVRQEAARLVPDADQAEDLSQEALLAALEYGGHRVQQPRAFLRRVLRTRWLNKQRSCAGRERGLPLAGDAVQVRDDSLEEPHRLLEQREERERLLARLSRLPEAHRQVLELRFLLGMDYTGVADVLGVSTTAARQRVARALAALRRAGARQGCPEER